MSNHVLLWNGTILFLDKPFKPTERWLKTHTHTHTNGLNLGCLGSLTQTPFWSFGCKIWQGFCTTNFLGTLSAGEEMAACALGSGTRGAALSGHWRLFLPGLKKSCASLAVLCWIPWHVFCSRCIYCSHCSCLVVSQDDNITSDTCNRRVLHGSNAKEQCCFVLNPVACLL